MRARDVREPVQVREPLRHVWPEHVPHASLALKEPGNPIVRITPKQIGERAIEHRLLEPVNDIDLLEQVDRRRQPAVHAEHAPVDERGERHVIEQVAAALVNCHVAELEAALVVEPVESRDGLGLVVSAEHVHAVGGLDFQAKEIHEHFEGVIATVDVVAEEQELAFRRGRFDSENLVEIVKLAVDIADDDDRSLQFQAVVFLNEKSLRVVDDVVRLGRGEELWRCHRELGNDLVDIELAHFALSVVYGSIVVVIPC